MSELWRITVDVPDRMLVPAKKRGQKKLVPCGLPALGNQRDWLHKHHLVAKHKQLLAQAAAKRGVEGLPGLGLPKSERRYDVLFLRCAPRFLDAGIIAGAGADEKRYGGDNGTSWAKGWRDAMAAWLGLKSDADPNVRWHCGQERSDAPRQYQVIVIVAPWAEDPWELPRRWLTRSLVTGRLVG